MNRVEVLARSAASFLIYARIPLLTAMATLALAEAYFILHTAPAFMLPALGVSVLVAAAISWVHLRHFGLALLVAAAPVPGLLWGFALLTEAWSYAFAFAFTAMMAGTFLRGLLRGLEKRDAAAAMLGIGPALAGTLLFSFASLLQGWILAIPLMLGCAAAALIFPCGAYLIPFGEDFFARANRIGERRQRSLGIISFSASSHWGLSLSGITLVFAVLGYFRSGFPPLLAWLPVAVILAIAFIWLRDLRAAAAIGIGAGVLTLFGAGWSVASALYVFFALQVGLRAKRHRKSGNGDELAWSRAMEDEGISIFFAAIGAAAILLAARSASLAILVFGGGIAALIFVPGLTAGISTLLPRRRSVEELYGSG